MKSCHRRYNGIVGELEHPLHQIRTLKFNDGPDTTPGASRSWPNGRAGRRNRGTSLRLASVQPRRATLEFIRRAFEVAGIEFIDENGGGAGVRLKKPHQAAKRK